MAVPFLSMYATQHLHFTLQQTGFLITIYGIFSIAGATLGGWLTDKIGFRSVQICAAISAGLVFFAIPMAESFLSLSGLTALLSVMAEAFRPANMTAVASYSVPEKLTRSYSLNRLAINIGWAAGSSLGGLLAAINYKLLFWVDGGTSIAAGVLIWALLPNRRQAQKTQKANAPAVVRKPWQDKLFVQFFFYSVLYVTAFFLVFRIVPIYWKEQWHLNEGFIGLALGLNGVIIGLVEMLLITKLEKGGRPYLQYIVAGALVCGLGFALLLLPGWWPFAQAIVFMVVVTLSEMLTLPFMNTFVISRSNSYNRGQYAAGFTLTWGASQILGPAGGTFIAAQAGYNWLWVALICLCILGAVGFGFLQKNSEPMA